MWSHYSNSHSGVCIGYNLWNMYESLEEIPNSSKALFKMEYKRDFETKDFFEDRYEAIIHWIKTKSSFWAYEEEIRLFYHNIKLNEYGRRLVSISKKSFSEIIYGFNYDFKKNSALTNFIKIHYPTLAQYKMQPKPDSFELERIKLN